MHKLTWVACCLRVTQISLRANAFMIVVVAHTDGVRATLCQLTCIYTRALVADFFDFTIIVRVAFWDSCNSVALAPVVRHSPVRAQACNTPGGNGVFDNTLL